MANERPPNRVPGALFAYGTLLVPALMARVVGRVPGAAPAWLDDHQRYVVRGAVYPGAVAEPGKTVAGLLYSGLSASEWERLDDYEGALYERVPVVVRLEGGARVTVESYLVGQDARGALSEVVWELETFLRDHAAEFGPEVG